MRQWDLFLVSSKKLEIGNVKELKNKVKSFDELIEILNKADVHLALV